MTPAKIECDACKVACDVCQVVCDVCKVDFDMCKVQREAYKLVFDTCVNIRYEESVKGTNNEILHRGSSEKA